jgi:fumarylacetoacetase
VDFYRPCGQIIDKELSTPDNPIPKFSPTQALDFELEMATIIGKPSELGERITTEKAEEHIFGFVLFNDWSARDIQRWEYQPL